jgi:hypothetical protein
MCLLLSRLQGATSVRICTVVPVQRQNLYFSTSNARKLGIYRDPTTTGCPSFIRPVLSRDACQEAVSLRPHAQVA